MNDATPDERQAMAPCNGYGACEQGMTPEVYTRAALRTAAGGNEENDDNMTVTLTAHQYRLLMGAIGLAGEAGEVAELVKKHVFHNHPFNYEKMEKELGDVAWYHTYLTVKGVKSTLRTIWEKNIAKLAARYTGNVFNSQESMHRKVGDE